MPTAPKTSVSGPGSQSQRTDVGPQQQPIRVPTGQPYGQAKQLENMQQAVSIPNLEPDQPGRPPGGGGSSPAVQAMPNSNELLQLLGHTTNRPGEPVTAPSPVGARPVPLNQIIGALENVMATSDTIPASVMRLYQGLRVEAAKQGGAGTIL